MERVLKNLKPEKIWFYFEEITRIPRPSKKEHEIGAFLVDFGKKHNLETIQDKIGNVMIRKAASKGYENLDSVVLQSHMDMVCEKNSSLDHDFENDPIETYIDEGWVKAKGTTLGADDGIGMAIQLAILASDDINHGPIECLFTVDEETGLSGAAAIKPGFIKSKYLINLDSEDEGQIFIGCAGGRDTIATFNYQKEPVGKTSIAFEVRVEGLRGGHSGDDINKGLGNSVKILNRLLWNANYLFNVKVAKIDAGNLRNAIAREGFAIITIDPQNKKPLFDYIEKYNQIVREELKSTEPNLKVSISPAEMPVSMIESSSLINILYALYACPHGVISMSADIPGLVETSTNLASIKTTDKQIIVTTSQRSSVETAKQDILNMVDCVFLLAGAKTIHGDGYPGWKPNLKSKILEITKKSYKKLYHKTPKVLAIHAGLECGLIGEKYPGIEMISIGPTLRGVHSPDEKIEINSVQKCWDLLLDVLQNIPKK